MLKLFSPAVTSTQLLLQRDIAHIVWEGSTCPTWKRLKDLLAYKPGKSPTKEKSPRMIHDFQILRYDSYSNKIMHVKYDMSRKLRSMTNVSQHKSFQSFLLHAFTFAVRWKLLQIYKTPLEVAGNWGPVLLQHWLLQPGACGSLRGAPPRSHQKKQDSWATKNDDCRYWYKLSEKVMVLSSYHFKMSFAPEYVGTLFK